MTEQINVYDQKIEELCKESYPETQLMRQISGVGPLTALAYVLTLEASGRFQKSREVGPALGLVPRRDQSGDQDPQLHITRTGDVYLRRLLVVAAQYILGPFGPDCDLRHWGLKVAERGGKPVLAVQARERQKESRRGGGPQAGDPDAPSVEDGGGL